MSKEKSKSNVQQKEGGFSLANAKEKKSALHVKKKSSTAGNEPGEITSTKELKEFLLSVRDRMADDHAPTINVVSAMNYVLNIPTIAELLDQETKEIARDIWLRIKQDGLQLKNPPLLFDANEAVANLG